MKIVLNVETQEIVSAICAIENTIAQKQASLLKSDVKPLVDFQKSQILNLKSFLKSLNKFKVLEF